MTTFNYDLAADIAPYRAGLGPNYIIEPTLQASRAVDLLKLHGSLNWATELPETDSFFRHLFALGSAGKSALRRLIVFNPDETVGARFRALLGPGALARYEFRSQTFWRCHRDVERNLSTQGTTPYSFQPKMVG